MLLPFQIHFEEHFPHLHDSRILVAVSGGVDSVVLTHLCHQLGLDISLAHCNFHLRGEESDMDEAFILEMGDALDLEVFVEHFETEAYAEEKKCSVQMAARELRYHWFEDLRETLGYDYIFTAHHANDDLETFLINLIRGTGLEGLTGIPERNGFVLRPLLPFSRSVIEEFARSSQIRWREDSSNASGKYLRNKIRQDIVPVMEELNPQLLDSFLKTQNHLNQSAELIEDYVGAIFSRVAMKHKYGYSFNIKLLQTIPNLRALLYELFRTFGFTEWEDVFQLLEAQSGKNVVSKTHRLIKDRDDLILTELPSGEEFHAEISDEEEVIMLPVGTFHLEPADELSEVTSHCIYVDRSKLVFPLEVRNWKEGDFFYPFGMDGKKKLSKFFKDIKLSLPEKEHCLVLCSGGDIVWVVDHRADSRFSVDKDSTEILKITYTQ